MEPAVGVLDGGDFRFAGAGEGASIASAEC